MRPAAKTGLALLLAVLLVPAGGYLSWRLVDAHDTEVQGSRDNGERSVREEEARLLRLIATREKELGAEHPLTLSSVHDLGTRYAYRAMGEKARPLLERVRAAYEKAPPSSELADVLSALSLVERMEGNRQAARLLLHRALEIREKALGTENIWIAGNLLSLGDFYAAEHDAGHAESYFRRALAIAEKAKGHERAETFRSMALEGLARLPGRPEQPGQ